MAKGKKYEDAARRYDRQRLHTPTEALADNYFAVAEELTRAKPASAKGRYVRKVSLASTMGPGVHVDPARFRREDNKEDAAPAA
jgi:large subunit ribosomal protein L1